jgi:predicted nuclease of restriction endonuclease-like (RecB) superfamily
MGRKKQGSGMELTAADAMPAGYAVFLEDLKTRVHSAQLRAAVAVNTELIQLYWDIGRGVVERQRTDGWGSKVVNLLGRDLQVAFPGVGGFSRQNLYRMRAFYQAYSEPGPIVSQAARQLDSPPPAVAALPWFHNVTIFERVKNPEARLWYARATREFGWSRAVLEHQIDTNAHRRRGKAVTNFDRALPAPQSDLARETLKDPYSFQFLTLAEEHAEADLQRGLVNHIRKFLLELGAGFAFVGEQYHLEVGGDDFYLDLLFYHLTLRCFVVFDLKARRFTPEAAGKMNFYLSAVDDLLRHISDNPSVGVVLCKHKNEVVAEYALRDVQKPLAVSTYVTRLLESLPAELRAELPPPDESVRSGTKQKKV